jgi:hypothetical protein
MTALLILVSAILSAFACSFVVTPAFAGLLRAIDRRVKKPSRETVTISQTIRVTRVPITFGCELVLASSLLVASSTIVIQQAPMSVTVMQTYA